eukprot:145965-Chlamydomonas_euryale.AAC.2
MVEVKAGRRQGACAYMSALRISSRVVRHNIKAPSWPVAPATPATPAPTELPPMWAQNTLLPSPLPPDLLHCSCPARKDPPASSREPRSSAGAHHHRAESHTHAQGRSSIEPRANPAEPLTASCTLTPSRNPKSVDIPRYSTVHAASVKPHTFALMHFRTLSGLPAARRATTSSRSSATKKSPCTLRSCTCGPIVAKKGGQIERKQVTEGQASLGVLLVHLSVFV